MPASPGLEFPASQLDSLDHRAFSYILASHEGLRSAGLGVAGIFIVVLVLIAYEFSRAFVHTYEDRQ
jgi:hypothetical protein